MPRASVALVFGVSFAELILISAVALIVVGPSRLPAMLGTLGRWANKLRRTLFEVRHQSGIDEILRSEGISGGLHEIRALKSAVRGDLGSFARNAVGGGPAKTTNQAAPQTPDVAAPPPPVDPYSTVSYDRSREYPDEGCDAYGAIPDDLWSATHPEADASVKPPETGVDASAQSAAAAPPAAANNSVADAEQPAQSETNTEGASSVEPEAPTSATPSKAAPKP